MLKFCTTYSVSQLRSGYTKYFVPDDPGINSSFLHRIQDNVVLIIYLNFKHIHNI